MWHSLGCHVVRILLRCRMLTGLNSTIKASIASPLSRLSSAADCNDQQRRVVDRSIPPPGKGASAGYFLLWLVLHHTHVVYLYHCSHAPALAAHAAVANSLPRLAALLLTQLGSFLKPTPKPYNCSMFCVIGFEYQVLAVQVCAQQMNLQGWQPQHNPSSVHC